MARQTEKHRHVGDGSWWVRFGLISMMHIRKILLQSDTGGLLAMKARSLLWACVVRFFLTVCFALRFYSVRSKWYLCWSATSGRVVLCLHGMLRWNSTSGGKHVVHFRVVRLLWSSLTRSFHL